MGVFSRPDSPYWWFWLETAPRGRRRERSDIRIGTTNDARHDSRQLAEARYHQRMNELAAHVHRLPIARDGITVAKLIELYTAHELPHHRGAEREREILRTLRAAFGRVGVDQVDVELVKAWRTKRRTTSRVVEHFGGPKGPRRTFPPPSARTVNKEVDVLQQVFTYAVPKYLAASPIAGLSDLEVVAPKRRLLTARELARLLAQATRLERAFLLLAYDGLIRQGDLIDLQRSDWHGHWLYVAHPKSGEPYEVALSARAEAALKACPGTGQYIFPGFRATTGRDARAKVRRMFAALCKRAKVKYGRAQHGLTFHWATRRSGATRLVVDRKEAIPAVQKQGGWKRPDVLLGIYAEADKAAQLAMMRSLPVHSRKKRRSA